MQSRSWFRTWSVKQRGCILFCVQQLRSHHKQEGRRLKSCSGQFQASIIQTLDQLKNRHTVQMVDRFMYIDCTTQINHSWWRSQHQNGKDQLCFQETSPDNLGAPWDIKLAAQQRVYHAAALPTLLAACETKTVYRRHSPLTHNVCARDQVAG